MLEPLNCEECGGRGYDTGSIAELEECPVCLGSGKQLVELSPSSANYGNRKPMGRATLPPAPVEGEIEWHDWRFGQ